MNENTSVTNLGDLIRLATSSPSLYDEILNTSRMVQPHNPTSSPQFPGALASDANFKDGKEQWTVAEEPCDGRGLTEGYQIDRSASAQRTVQPFTGGSTTTLINPTHHQAQFPVSHRRQDPSEQDGEVGDRNFTSTPPISRAVLYARQYRQEKKRPLNELKTENEHLRRENNKLKEAHADETVKVESMKRVVTYLRQILANDRAIAQVLNAVVPNSPGVELQTPHSADGPDQRSPSTTVARGAAAGVTSGPPPVGFCFHINDGAVSVEFCLQCHRGATRHRADQT